MATTTLGQRLTAAMNQLGIHPAELARRAKMTTATMANWLNDKVVVDHVKASTLFQIADAAEINARELLWGQEDRFAPTHIREGVAAYASQAVTLDEWIIAFQLVAEALDDKGLALPPAKRAEVTLLAHDLLVEGMPRAKVLRFVQAAAA